MTAVQLNAQIWRDMAAIADSEPLMKQLAKYLKKLVAKKPALLWIGCGNTDFLFNANKEFMSKLDKNGFKYTFMETEGGHIWKNWRIYLTEFVPLIFK